MIRKRKCSPKASSLGAWQGLSGCFPSHCPSHDTEPRLPETTKCPLVTWATAEPHRVVGVAKIHDFPGGKREENLQKTGLELWLSRKLDLWFLSNSPYWAFEPSAVPESKQLLCLMHLDFVRSTKHYGNWVASATGVTNIALTASLSICISAHGQELSLPWGIYPHPSSLSS